MTDKQLMVLLDGLTKELGNCISEIITLMPDGAERETWQQEDSPVFTSICGMFATIRELGEWSPGNRFAALVPAFDLLDEWEIRFSRLAEIQE